MISAHKTILFLALFVLTAAICLSNARSVWHPVYSALVGRRTTADVLAELREPLEAHWAAACAEAGIAFPPSGVVLLGMKEERSLELWGRSEDADWARLATYPILAASGSAGPKLLEGDRQVPEGVYAIEGLNPNSAFHLSLKIGYPNAFDREQADREGRSNLGGDIFIHGKAVSVGCLAIGDRAVEEVFYLVARAGCEKARVVIMPHDLRVQEDVEIPEGREWTRELYAGVRDALIPFD